jgi:nucleotidyltransferase/DNA polymerase involved in DNA repair
VAEVALAFGAPVSIAEEVVWVDVEGSARLFGGEPALAAALAEQVSALGEPARVAIAGSPTGAAALARHGEPAWRVVPAGQDGQALAPLPLEALPLSDEDRLWLNRLGARRVRDLARLPRKQLSLRLGGEAALALLDGKGETPLDPWTPPETIEESLELVEPVVTLEALRFVLKTLCDRLSARLRGRRARVTRLGLALGLPHGERCLELTLGTPLGEAAELVGVLCAKLERDAKGEEGEEIRRARLTALSLSVRTPRMLDLFTPEPVTRAALPRLYAELVCELGAERVGCLALADRWEPETRQILVPWGEALGGALDLEEGPHPTRLLGRGDPPPDDAQPLRVLHRLAAVEWWQGKGRAVDHVAAWSESAQAMAWVEIEVGTGASVLRGWIE